MKLEPRLSRRSSVQGTTDTEKAISEKLKGSNRLSAKLSSQADHEDYRAEEAEEREGCLARYTSCRWVIGYMCCAARFSQSAIRQCIGMAVVCMTLQQGQQHAHSAGSSSQAASTGIGAMANRSDGVVEDEVSVRADFSWSPEFEGLILNAFNIGFFFSPILGGHIAGSFGGKRVILVALLAGSIATICLPLAARLSDIFMMVLRILAGMFLGTVDPAIQALWARWAPKYEKAKLTTCSYTGLSLAGMLTFFVSGHLCGIRVDNGWPFIFYFFGGFAFLCVIPWVFLVYDSPEEHPRIPDYEKRLIAKGKGQKASNKTLATPWRRMLTSGPFWAIVLAHVSYSWVTSWMMAYLPKYLNDVMKFNLEEDGLYSSLPYVGRLITGFLSGYLSDRVLHAGFLSTAGTRKLFQTVGCLFSAACTLAVGFLDHNAREAAVVLLVLAMSFHNLTSVAFRINHLDIAPRFAGVMMGMTVTAAMACSLTGPLVTAALIPNGTQQEWMAVFIIVAAVNIIGAIVFSLFGSGEVQDWALPPKTADDAKEAAVVTISSGGESNSEKEDTASWAYNTNDIVYTEVSEAEGEAEPCSTEAEGESQPPCLRNHSETDASPVLTTEGSIYKSESDHDKQHVTVDNGRPYKNMQTSVYPAPPPPKCTLSQTMSMPAIPKNSYGKRGMLRKRTSSSDLQQVNESKPRPSASTKPSLSTHADTEGNKSG